MSADASVRREDVGLLTRSRRRTAGTGSGGSAARRDDDALMCLIRAGREDAFEELYDRYAVRAYRVARSVCGEQHDAEEAVHEAFVSIWRGGATLRPRQGGVAAWLLTVVGDQAVSLARRASGPIAGGASSDECEVKTLGLPAGAEDRSEARVRKALLTALPDAQRDVIVLACYGELTLEEIASQLALAPAAVKDRMRLGLRRLLAHSEQPTT